MNELIKINYDNDRIAIADTNVSIKEYNGNRVVTFKDIDAVHGRPGGTARRNFNRNKEHFIEGEDYFVRNSYEAKKEFNATAPNGVMLITESGYLMLAKSFTDKKAWDVQRELVKSYFRVKQEQPKIESRADSVTDEIYEIISKRHDVISDKDIGELYGYFHAWYDEIENEKVKNIRDIDENMIFKISELKRYAAALNSVIDGAKIILENTMKLAIK